MKWTSDQRRLCQAGSRVTTSTPPQRSLDLLRERLLCDVADAALQKEGWAFNPTVDDTINKLDFPVDYHEDDSKVQKQSSVKAAILKNWWSLQDASEDMKGNKEIMLLAVQQDWRALKYAAAPLKVDRDVVLAAVQYDGKAILWALEPLKDDKEIIMECIRQDGNYLRFASTRLRSDKDCVVAAVTNRPEALKFAMNGLNQDQDCLIAAKLWDANYNRTSTAQQQQQDVEDNDSNPRRDTLVSILPPNAKKIVLSTRFALDEDSTPTATQFTVLLKEHPYF